MTAPRGNPKLDQVRNKDTTEANKKRKSLADDHARVIAAALLRASTVDDIGMPFGNYADWLNANGYSTRRGHAWTGRTVSRVFQKLHDSDFAESLKPKGD
jgi:hypothetical protein